jgi:hypothetical protein
MKDEIINDILRDMEADAEAAWEGTSLRRALVKYATRLRKALNAPALATGNAAAMRDLLEKIRREYGWGRIGCRTCVSSEADVERVSDLFEKQIDAALSAPARNCDRYATLDEARKAFQEARGHKVLADVELWDSMDEAGALVRWLFAPAKGENKQ